MEQERRRWFTWREAALLALALAVLSGALLYQRYCEAGGSVARLYVGGEMVETIPLNGEDAVFSLEERYGVPASLERSGGHIRFVHVDCPDHLCEKTGWIGDDGQMAVCMPNRAALVIES